jgi:hypothetical protein
VLASIISPSTVVRYATSGVGDSFAIAILGPTVCFQQVGADG